MSTNVNTQKQAKTVYCTVRRPEYRLMFFMPFTVIKSLVSRTLLQSGAVVLMLMLGFVLVEPAISLSASATDTFTIRQQITSEISFLVSAANVTMNGTIGGLTGGTATGTTQAVVRTNSATGYTMDIKFANSPAMQGEATGGIGIHDYAEVGVEPDYSFVASTSAVFAYTVSASTTSDLDPSFLDNGATACGAGTYSVDHCWKGPATTDFRVINRSSSAGSGATTSFTFVVDVPNNPSPSVESDYYTATATLTATTQ